MFQKLRFKLKFRDLLNYFNLEFQVYQKLLVLELIFNFNFYNANLFAFTWKLNTCRMPF